MPIQLDVLSWQSREPEDGADKSQQLFHCSRYQFRKGVIGSRLSDAVNSIRLDILIDCST